MKQAAIEIIKTGSTQIEPVKNAGTLSTYVQEDDDETAVQEDDGLTQAYKQIAQLASDVDENPEDAEDQWELASEVARPITKILKQIMDYDKGVQMPDGSDMSYPDVFKKVSILANKGAQTNDPKMAAEIFKTMSSVYDMKQVAEESVSEDEDELGRLKELSGIEEDDNESKYYEYTGKGFAIRPSGQSVWADKADIPSVINVESIMISHYPDMDDYVELTMEHDGPWEIYTDKAVEAALEKTLGMPSGSIKWSEQGQQEKGRAHFDVASTAIGKVSGSSMFKQVQAEESYEPFPDEDEMTFEDDDAFYEAFGELGFPEDETELFDAEYRGRKVPLNKPMRGDVKKFKVYVKDPKTGNVKKVNFGHGGSSARRAGQKTMKIRKSNPKARKSFRARHNCANPGPKTKARYWSCRAW
jgi:hypothetical protein